MSEVFKPHKHFKLEFQTEAKNCCSFISVLRRTASRLRQMACHVKIQPKDLSSIYCRLYTMSTRDETLWILIQCVNNYGSAISCLLADSGDAPRVLEGPQTTQVENIYIMKLHSLYRPVTRDTVHVWTEIIFPINISLTLKIIVQIQYSCANDTANTVTVHSVMVIDKSWFWEHKKRALYENWVKIM